MCRLRLCGLTQLLASADPASARTVDPSPSCPMLRPASSQTHNSQGDPLLVHKLPPCASPYLQAGIYVDRIAHSLASSSATFPPSLSSSAPLLLSRALATALIFLDPIFTRYSARPRCFRRRPVSTRATFRSTPLLPRRVRSCATYWMRRNSSLRSGYFDDAGTRSTSRRHT
ncbi:hypothetical protein B0H19DRAFT_429988 [Mycena capillaripes]|nr:hypothetical protein B0H19DRAFT_429988 [Mycena capillaripes]